MKLNMGALPGKNVNKWLIGAILGTTILGVTGYSMTPKGKKTMKGLRGLLKKVVDFFQLGLDNLKKELDSDSADKKKNNEE